MPTDFLDWNAAVISSSSPSSRLSNWNRFGTAVRPFLGGPFSFRGLGAGGGGYGWAHSSTS